MGVGLRQLLAGDPAYPIPGELRNSYHDQPCYAEFSVPV